MSAVLSVIGTALLILLAVLCAVFFLLGTVFFSRLRIFLRYREKLEILLQLWFIKINITKLTSRKKKQKAPKLLHFDGQHFGELPQKPEKQKNKKNIQAAHKVSKGTANPATTTQPKEKQSVGNILDMVRDILSDISSPLKKCIDVKIHRLYVTAASKEAADTAVMFGHLNTAVSSLILVCKKFRNLEIDESCTGVYSDFTSEKPRLDTEIELICHIRHITVTGIKGLMGYLKYKK